MQYKIINWECRAEHVLEHTTKSKIFVTQCSLNCSFLHSPAVSDGVIGSENRA